MSIKKVELRISKEDALRVLKGNEHHYSAQIEKCTQELLSRYGSSDLVQMAKYFSMKAIYTDMLNFNSQVKEAIESDKYGNMDKYLMQEIRWYVGLEVAYSTSIVREMESRAKREVSQKKIMVLRSIFKTPNDNLLSSMLNF